MPLGKGHIVMFALRPFWRWQTQGTYFLAFNAILNWDHLDAGKENRAVAARGLGTKLYVLNCIILVPWGRVHWFVVPAPGLT